MQKKERGKKIHASVRPERENTLVECVGLCVVGRILSCGLSAKSWIPSPM